MTIRSPLSSVTSIPAGPRVAGRCVALLCMMVLSGCAALGHEASGPSNIDNAAQDRAASALSETVAGNDDAARLAGALSVIYDDAPEPSTRYVSAFVDLDGDGQKDAVAYVFGGQRCENGCDLYVFRRAGSAFEVINRIPAARPPLYGVPAGHGLDLLTHVMDSSGLQRFQQRGGAYVPGDEQTGADMAGRRRLIPRIDAGAGQTVPSR